MPLRQRQHNLDIRFTNGVLCRFPGWSKPSPRGLLRSKMTTYGTYGIGVDPVSGRWQKKLIRVNFLFRVALSEGQMRKLLITLAVLVSIPASAQWDAAYEFEVVGASEVGHAIVKYRRDRPGIEEWQSTVISIFSSLHGSRGPNAAPRPPCDTAINTSPAAIQAFLRLMPPTFFTPDDGQVMTWNYDRPFVEEAPPMEVDLSGDDFLRTLYDANLYCPE